MPKDRSGYVFEENGRWYARITYTDGSGKRRNVKRIAENKTGAKEILRKILRELEDYGERTMESSRMTFGQLADYYAERYLIPPRYVDGRKIAGLRSHYDMKFYLRTIREHFGSRQLRSITHGDIEQFKLTRLATMTKFGKQRSVAAVNRELAMLRRMLNIAQREGWIIKNPFVSGDSLISLADERKRERILNREEEARLLNACIGPRTHLRPIVICAIDTGMRKGEILQLQWADIDFTNKLITIRQLNTKTLLARQVAMTERLTHELELLCELSASGANSLVFGITADVKRAFNSARKIAGLSDVRFHDLRHTHATRLVAAHMPLSEVGRVLGHTQANTTYRYVNATVETARRAAAVLDEFHAESEKQDDAETIN